MQIFESFDDALLATLSSVRDHGCDVPPVLDERSIGSNFGRKSRSTRELIGIGFRVKDVRTRLMTGSARAMNLAFAIANTLFTIACHDDDAMISAYNERSRMFVEAGKLRGAVGCRMFGHTTEESRNQFASAIDLLRADPTSRRAVVLVMTPDDLSERPLDTPCTIALQIFIRNGHLEMLTIMRSQSVYMVMPYDLFLFSMLQEMVACELGLPVGAYYHFAGSAHYYDDERELVDRCLEVPLRPAARMPHMNRSLLFDTERLMSAERDIRARITLDVNATTDDVLARVDPYWRDLLMILDRDLRLKSRELGDSSPGSSSGGGAI